MISADSARPDLYISADVETDGSIPGPYSMLSFGLTVVGSYAGDRLRRVAPGSATFYRELRPISDEYEQEALDVNGLDRDELVAAGADPSTAMEEAARWVREVANDRRPVLVAYPVAFDWSFLYWYFERFAPSGSPFGFSSCLDIRTLYQAAAGTVHDASGKDSMPPALLPVAPHTHNALDDALEQGELFANVFDWASERRLASRHVDSVAPDWLRAHLAPDFRVARLAPPSATDAARPTTQQAKRCRSTEWPLTLLARPRRTERGLTHLTPRQRASVGHGAPSCRSGGR